MMKHLRFCFVSALLTFVGCVCHAQSAHPVFFKLFAPGTLYADAIHQSVFCTDTDDSDRVFATNHAINDAVVRAFVNKPWLFSTTQSDLDDQLPMSDVVAENIVKDEPMPLAGVFEETPVDIADEVELDIEVKKPNFWKFDGSGSVQFTQNHYSENWYQGGEDYFSMLALLKLHLLYDNKDKFLWETTLDAKLGFQTVENDEFRNFRTNNDQIRLTTKIGYAAFKNWYYTFQGMSESQFCRTYQPNTMNILGEFASPIKTVLSIGLDYKWNIKRFSGSLYIAPLAMTWVHVGRVELAERYGNDPGQLNKVTWGPNVTVQWKFVPWENITWESRLYWFSNFSYTNIEWENTLSFKVNRFVNAKLYLYPRFDDSSEKYMNENGSYFMFKEWLSLGLEYSF